MGSRSIITTNAAGQITAESFSDGSQYASSIFSAGNIGSVTLGAIDDSSIFAGIGSGVTGFPGVSQDITAVATIGAVTVKGIPSKAANPPASFIGSDVAASKITTVSLYSVQVANSGTPFGLAAESIGALTITKPKVKDTKLDTAISAASGSSADFLIRIF
jgi:hypothetical protein